MGVATFTICLYRGTLDMTNPLGPPGRKYELFCMSFLRAINSIFWLFGLMFVSLVTANTLVYASPLFAALLGHFCIGGAEKVTRQGAFLLFLSFVGLILVIHPWVTDPEVPDNADKTSSFWQLVGSLSELSVAVWLALYQILSRRNKDIGFPTVITTFTMYSTMIIAVVLSILAFCGWSEPFFVPLSGYQRLNLLGYAAFGSTGHILQLVSYQQGEVVTMAMLGYFEPVLTVFAQLFVLKQPISALSAIGCGLVVSCGATEVWLKNRSNAAAQSAARAFSTLPTDEHAVDTDIELTKGQADLAEL